MNDQPSWPDWLKNTLAEFDCQTGTIHRTTGDGKTLSLVCQIGVPDTLLEKIATIPFGKGIAGVAAERGEAVELCNLQQDLKGVAKVGARQTGVSGSLAVPVFASPGGPVVGTLGVGKFTPHEFSDGEKERLRSLASEVAVHFADKPA